MGRPAKNKTFTDLEPVLQDEINAAIDSAADESAAGIFRRFGLATRGLLADTFGKYVKERRRRDAIPDEGMAEMLANPPTWDELDKRARVHALRLLQAGDAKMYEICLLSRGRRESDKLDLDKAAEARANEKHEAWKTAYQRDQAAALEAMQGSTPGLTPELLATIKSKVLGI